MSQALATTTPPTNTNIMARISEFQTIAKLFAASGLFTDVKSEAQCFVKVMAGAELGIPPFTAMNSFHIIQGKATMTANTIAARVKASGRYDYRVIEKTAAVCSIQFCEHGKPVHVETWDANRARMAGVQNMGKYPDAMLFARCITAGARAVCPDIVGQFYTPEEMGATVNAEGEVIQGETREVQRPVIAETPATTQEDAPAVTTPQEKAAKLLTYINDNRQTLTVKQSRQANAKAVLYATDTGLDSTFIDGHTSPADEGSGIAMITHAEALLTAVIAGKTPELVA